MAISTVQSLFLYLGDKYVEAGRDERKFYSYSRIPDIVSLIRTTVKLAVSDKGGVSVLSFQLHGKKVFAACKSGCCSFLLWMVADGRCMMDYGLQCLDCLRSMGKTRINMDVATQMKIGLNGDLDRLRIVLNIRQ